MRFRALDKNGDWTYGAGQNNFAQGQAAAQFTIQTRVLSFLGDCFFDMGAGIDWFAYLGTVGDDAEIALKLAVGAVILNTLDENGNQVVLGLQTLTVTLNRQTRNLTVTYRAVSIYSTLTGSFSYDLNGLS